MAVPSRHVRGVEAAHAARLYDKILQGFVEGGAEVDRAIGIRRTIVQDVNRLPPVRLTNAVVDLGFLPVGEHFGLVLGQVRLHGEVGFGQIQRCFQIERHSVFLPPAGYWIRKLLQAICSL